MIPLETTNTRLTSRDDLGAMVARAAGIEPSADAGAAAARYDGPALHAAETRRDEDQKRRIAELRRRFVDGPVVVFPRSTNNAYTTNTMTALPGEGTVYPTFRATAEWGTLEGAEVLMALDRSRLTVPGPVKIEGATLSGDGWSAQLAEGWVIRPGARAGDFQIVRDKP